MIRTNRLASIHFLEPEKDFTFGFFEQLYISTDKGIVDKFFTPKELIPIIGHNEYRSITETGVFIYAGMEVELDENEFSDRTFLINFLLLVELFCQSTWFIKDNSIQNELGHLVYQTKSDLKVHTNLWHSSYTNCLGTRTNTKFTIDEIRAALELLPTIFEIHFVGENALDEAVRVTHKVSRLARAFYFLQSARNVEDIGTKLAHYCSVFESVFSTSTTELRHRLSETVAFFLETEYEKRIAVYKSLQMAYDIRSSIVHGDGVSSKFLKNKNALLIQTTIETDEILRRCLRKIVSDEELLKLFTEKTKDDVSNYTQNLIFTAPNRGGGCTTTFLMH